ncbi:glycosyltransferase, partial [Candidatus Gottesmanbacteria bacterium]|nr:glycosyltransferase [Candidatus Gottesmanbacteria bacterium]
MTIHKKPTATIGIPTYQSQENISQLLLSLWKQRVQKVDIEKILVYCDGCTDKTYEFALSLSKLYDKIHIYDGKRNRGYAYALQYLADKNRSDILVLINDDIKISSPVVIENLVNPLLKNPTTGLVSGHVIALPPKSFVGRCIYTSYLAFAEMRLNYKRGQSRLTLDGKILALRKEFADSLNLTDFPTGNVDIFIYFENLKQGRKYNFAKDAKIYYRLPETMADFRNQESRTIKSFALLEDHFGDIVRKEWQVPRKEYFY